MLSHINSLQILCTVVLPGAARCAIYRKQSSDRILTRVTLSPYNTNLPKYNQHGKRMKLYNKFARVSNSMVVVSWKAEEFGHSRVQHINISPQDFSNQALRNPRIPGMTTNRNYRVIMHYKNFLVTSRLQGETREVR